MARTARGMRLALIRVLSKSSAKASGRFTEPEHFLAKFIAAAHLPLPPANNQRMGGQPPTIIDCMAEQILVVYPKEMVLLLCGNCMLRSGNFLVGNFFVAPQRCLPQVT